MTDQAFPFTPEQLAVIEDLKTTTEPQATGDLRNTNGFCCLGRMCEVMGVPSQRAVNLNGEPDNHWVYGKTEAMASLPSETYHKLMMRSNGGKVYRKNLTKTYPSFEDWETELNLFDLNDTFGWSFKQIGEFIEQNPAAVFTNLERQV